jgi:hypothetical protein
MDGGCMFYSLWTGSRAARSAGETPDCRSLPVPPAHADTGLVKWCQPENGKQVRHEHEHGDLWTRGVDPADVDILKGTLGQPVVLGQGAYGIVYLGRWQATLVAVKVMLTSDSDAALGEVQGEADILRGLRHPNVVLLMAVCISPGHQVHCGPLPKPSLAESPVQPD